MNTLIRSLALPLLPLALASAAHAATIFNDTFDYTDWNSGAAPATSVWTINSGSLDAASIFQDGSPLAPGPHLFLNNATTYANLGQTVLTDFTLSVSAIHQDYERALWVGVFNAAGTQGYGFFWDSSTPSNFSGEGFVKIVKYDVSNPATDLQFFSSGTALSDIAGSGHLAQSGPPASFNLSWIASTGTLTLESNSVSLASVTDASFSEFSRIYLGGNGGSRFDNIAFNTAAVPEPASATLIAALAVSAGVAGSRRRRAAIQN